MELVVGRIAKAHGITGEVVVDVRTDDPDARFGSGKTLRLKQSRSGRADDVVMRELAVESVDGYVTDARLVVGAKLLVPVKEGSAFRPNQVHSRPVIRRGDSVRVVGDFVRVRGTAVSDGRLGQDVRVKFPQTGKVLSCRVLGPGRAAMPGNQ